MFERVDSSAVDRPVWVMASRVLGAARADLGDIEAALHWCRAAVAAASTAYTRALATVYLGIVMIQAGLYRDVVGVAIDGGGDARLAGLDRSFGGYFDSEAAEALMRLGRWDDAEAVLVNRYAAGMDAFLHGRARVLVVAAVLAARRGDGESATASLVSARSRPVDVFHLPWLTSGAAEVALALGNWSDAVSATEAGWDASAARPWWAVRFAMLSTCAAVELALDQRARREPVDTARTRSTSGGAGRDRAIQDRHS